MFDLRYFQILPYTPRQIFFSLFLLILVSSFLKFLLFFLFFVFGSRMNQSLPRLPNTLSGLSNGLSGSQMRNNFGKTSHVNCLAEISNQKMLLVPFLTLILCIGTHAFLWCRESAMVVWFILFKKINFCNSCLGHFLFGHLRA